MMFAKKTMIAGNTRSFVKSRLVRMYGVALLCAGAYGGVSYAASSLTYELPPIPDLPAPQAEDSVPMADAGSFEEVKLDLPVTPGPFEPTWKSIEENYPGTPDWLRDAKFGIWVHFGPQSAGESGDWYARRLYAPGWAGDNHRKNYGDPTRIGYKDVLREWNPDKLDPRKLVEIYKDSGARYLIIQGVHHDQFDMWDSKYQPWNSTRLGPKRDLLGEWTKACRAEGMRFGITFHHEYSWWWWQTAFGHDEDGNPYDGNLTLADGEGTWWEGLDPRYLYGVNLREYKGVTAAAYSGWSPPPAGIFQNHLDFSEWYAKWWALRMMDAVDKYQPDFIYTDGTDQQPFSGFGTGTGYKCDAMQRVIADFYNKTLERRGKVDVFSIVKFRRKTNGTVNTQEGGIPGGIKTDQDWIAETPVGDWFYGPGFTYSSDAVIRYLLEEVSRDGNVGLCVSPLPDGSLDAGSSRMLKEIGEWMRINGEGIYGSRAWDVLGEGADGRLNVLPGGKIGGRQANHRFSTSDIRFTVGKDGNLYVWCMTVPKTGETLTIQSLASQSKLLGKPITSVELLGGRGQLRWKQDENGLHIHCPDTSEFRTAIGFKIGPASMILPKVPLNVSVRPSDGKAALSWQARDNNVTYIVKRALKEEGPYTILAEGKGSKYVDASARAGTLYYYTVAASNGENTSPDSEAVPVILSDGASSWTSQDIGGVAVAGSCGQAGDTFLVRGSGSDIWARHDEFQYVYKSLDGDGTIIAKVESMTDTEAWAKAGVMVRETLDSDSRQMILFMSPSQGIALQGRTGTGGDTAGFSAEGRLRAPCWLRLERNGTEITGSYSSDGETWTRLGSQTVELKKSVYVGLAVSSHNAGVLCNAVFSHVAID